MQLKTHNIKCHKPVEFRASDACNKGEKFKINDPNFNLKKIKNKILYVKTRYLWKRIKHCGKLN